MARDKEPTREQYGDVVARLTEIVQALEGGSLSLEDSLERFAEGVRLVKAGEALLADAEKRIEQLLSDDGRIAPLQLSEVKEPAAPRPQPSPGRVAKRPASPPAAKAPNDDLDDVPF